MQVNSVSSFNNVNFKADTSKIIKANTEAVVDKALPNDTFNLSKNEAKEITTEQKQKIIQQARTTAAGWSVFGSLISTAYFALRSDEKVAEKYGLDTEADASLIKKIKQDQTIATLPSVIGGLFLGVGTLVTGGITWLCAKNTDPAKIDVNKTF